MEKYITILFGFILFAPLLYAQDNLDSTFNKQYEENIKKSRINGVYIPVDLDDAFKELEELSSPESLQKYKMADELMAAKKLHFGLGRWMIYNWNFYDGSRFSHYLKAKGLGHPDDMARFVMICFHRHLNNRALDQDILINEIAEERMRYLKENNILWKPGIKRDTLDTGN